MHRAHRKNQAIIWREHNSLCLYNIIKWDVSLIKLNSIIHNFAFPGLPNLFHDMDKQTPYYCTLENSYKLCIPANLISILVEKYSSNLKDSIIQKINKTDPYKIFEDMPDWFPRLTKSKKCF